MRFKCEEVIPDKFMEYAGNTFMGLFLALMITGGGIWFPAVLGVKGLLGIPLAFVGGIILLAAIVGVMVAISGLYKLILKGREYLFPAHDWKQVYLKVPRRVEIPVQSSYGYRSDSLCVWRENVLKKVRYRGNYSRVVEYKVIDYDDLVTKYHAQSVQQLEAQHGTKVQTV